MVLDGECLDRAEPRIVATSQELLELQASYRKGELLLVSEIEGHELVQRLKETRDLGNRSLRLIGDEMIDPDRLVFLTKRRRIRQTRGERGLSMNFQEIGARICCGAWLRSHYFTVTALATLKFPRHLSNSTPAVRRHSEGGPAGPAGGGYQEKP